MSEHDPGSDPILCCLLEVCCDAAGAEAALATELAAIAEPAAQAKRVLELVDLAPKNFAPLRRWKVAQRKAQKARERG